MDSFDLYGKYLWTQMQGDSVRLSTGDPIDFESVNSHRLRFGGRYMFGSVFVPVASSSPMSSASRRITPYIGAAWEHEFGGTARASTNGFTIAAPSLRGGTGIGELGIAFQPASNRGVFVDLGVQGYTGKREGFTAAIHVGKNF